MSTTVRIRPQDKARLDRLQAEYLLKKGRRVSLDTMLHRILEAAEKHRDQWMDDETPRFSQAEIGRTLAALTSDHDVGEASEESIDDTLYGADPH